MVRALCRFDIIGINLVFDIIGINLVQTMAPGWRQIESEVALDLITIPAVSALVVPVLIILFLQRQLRHQLNDLHRSAEKKGAGFASDFGTYRTLASC